MESATRGLPWIVSPPSARAAGLGLRLGPSLGLALALAAGPARLSQTYSFKTMCCFDYELILNIVYENQSQFNLFQNICWGGGRMSISSRGKKVMEFEGI